MPYYRAKVTYRTSVDKGRSWTLYRNYPVSGIQGNTETAILNRLRKMYPSRVVEVVEIHGPPQKS